jgi:N4-gp56 family major capsid protein
VADTYTGQATLPYAQTAYDLMAYFALRPELYYDAVADIEPTQQSFPGSAVTFQIQNDIAAATATLSESSDVSAVALSASTVTLTLAEYGNAVITTALGRGTSFLDWDRLIGNVIGYNAGLSIDTVVKAILQAGTNVNYAAGNGTNVATARNQVSPANTLVSNDVRNAKAQLRRRYAPPISGSYYMAFIHGDVSYDLQGQTGAATWNEPHAYSAPEQIWEGELGGFQNFRFIETPRAPAFADAGSSTTLTDVYGTLFMGRQALAKAYSYVDGNGAYPTVVPSPITDHLRRFVGWGWYWLGVYGIFRQNSLVRVESASSIGANNAVGLAT